MKTFLNTKTGNRFPEHGCMSWFATWSNGKFQHHIKPGVPECTNGWKKVGKVWKAEEIPDLEKPFTDEQWIAYADKFGDACAMQFLETCDYMKPRAAFEMRNPPKNKEVWEANEVWFRSIFDAPLFRFLDGFSLSFGNTYTIDILRFEKHLIMGGYDPKINESMRDFITRTYGQEVTNHFSEIFLKRK